MPKLDLLATFLAVHIKYGCPHSDNADATITADVMPAGVAGDVVGGFSVCGTPANVTDEFLTIHRGHLFPCLSSMWKMKDA
jgi:hypothetical protein